MTESSMSDSIRLQASDPQDGGEYTGSNLEITYDSWQMFQSIWKSNLSITKSFQDKNHTLWMCFQLCYLFPTNYEFHKDHIIHLWIAHGLLEITALEYFDAFQAMSIFQFSSVTEPIYRLNASIVDLLQEHHDEEYCRVDDNDENISDSTLHSLVIGNSIESGTLNKLRRATNLRTLRVVNVQLEQVPRDLFMKFRSLRVLDFSTTSITELPSSIRNLIELRYLDLSKTPIEVLPNSICSLYKMETLKLRDCVKLAGLPRGMRKLVNLRYLDIDLACLLVSMPPGFGDLVELRILPAFVVGKESGCRIIELKHLVKLRGALHILRLENVTDANEAKEACLCLKNYVNKLELQWTDSRQDDSYGILESLEPPMQLEELEIVGYGDILFPKWIGSPCFSKLVTLVIHNCPKCEFLPPLGKLPLLKALSISEMHEVETIDHQFCGRDMELRHGREMETVSSEMLKAFPKLESLILNGIPKLQKWVGIMKGDFPNLKKLHILGCSMLIALPQFPHLNSIQKLEIRFCPSLESLPSGGLLNSLRDLVIVDCPLLSNRCKKDEEECRKLAHIASVWIDYLEFSGFRTFGSLEEEAEEDGNEENTQTSEIESLQTSNTEVAQAVEIQLVHQSNTEPVRHSENKSAQLLELESVESSHNRSQLSSQAGVLQMTKSHISWWNKRMLGYWDLAIGRDGYQLDKLMWSKPLGFHRNGEYSMATVQANISMEDQSQIESGRLWPSNISMEGQSQIKSGHLWSSYLGPEGTLVGVYDGHGGPEAARFIKEHLFNHIKKLMLEPHKMLADVIRKAFADTEADFLSLVDKQWKSLPQILAVGSSCLVGIICTEAKALGTLFVASVGDSRVVLGRTIDRSKGTEAVQLLTEHNVNIESARLELQSLHPDDPNIVVLKHGLWRVKGITTVSRSIGDAYLKDAKFNKEVLQPKFRVPDYQKPILSPEPSIFSMKLQRQDRYLIFASAGLWEHVSNEEAINIVDTYPRKGIARRLVKTAVQEAAKKREMKYTKLVKVESGARRHFHDDITVIVLFLDKLFPSDSFRPESRVGKTEFPAQKEFLNRKIKQ